MVATLVSVAAIGVLTPAALALTVSSVTLTSHTVASTAVAGDSFPVTANVEAECSVSESCEAVHLQVFFLDRNGAEQSVTVPGSSEATQALTAHIPGDEVRYPQLQYRLVVHRNVSSLVSAPPSGTQLPTAQQQYPPGGGYATVPVEVVIRGQLLRPDGSPAANMEVTAMPSNTGLRDLWRTRTDRAGRYRFTIDPTAKAFFADLFTRQRYLNLTVTGFDGWDQGVWPPIGAHTWVGLTRANLGEPLLDAVDRQFQDVPQTMEVYVHRAAASAGPDCFDTPEREWAANGWYDERVCVSESTLPPSRMRVADNAGAGQQMRTSWSHNSSTGTTSAAGVRAGATGGGWKVQAESQHQAEEASAIGFGPYASGPQWNISMDLIVHMHHRKAWTCRRYYEYSGGQPQWWCYAPNETVTLQKIVNAEPVWNYYNLHDQMHENEIVGYCKETDYAIRVYAYVTSANSVSRARGWTLDAGGEVGVVDLTFKQSYKTVEGVEVAYKWEPQPGDLHTFLFVRNGRFPAANRYDDPAHYPYKAYTHATWNEFAALPGGTSSDICPQYG